MVKNYSNRSTRNSIAFSIKRRCLKYTRLPRQLLRLTVLKLDGSSFSVNVGRNVTVGDLRLSIQEEFKNSLKEGEEHLWAVVWSHFCLCYKGEKLLDEKAGIRKYSIKDGDQLHFVRHLSAPPEMSRATTII
ncbi:U11/U12 small nuclear ribonucleoprotein 25 kDa protein-like [Andrographis paniculata]|uniref:U11/U12 small nuclear ribonucleoprotein 25 kDa protein-like n=1 Tax=Andrographis paniculata TaxID=175694 RepID=UPI0021E8799A|nr:U11/U12 small nuclear ribonucleoprotein 25 kDa protein-like [Andrographis paniculata]